MTQLTVHLMKLQPIDNVNFLRLSHQYTVNAGDTIDKSLEKLFSSLNNETNRYEVSIKVAALNQIYSTAIQYIDPVVSKISEHIDNNHHEFSTEQYVKLVDDISTVSWVSSTSGKVHKRNNLSFCSKYVHFLSKYTIPIYDSYIWILIIGYLKQAGYKHLSFAPPASYASFFDTFQIFKNAFSLHEHSNYAINKYLWVYGKQLITEIAKTQAVNLEKAKSILKSQLISEASNGNNEMQIQGQETMNTEIPAETLIALQHNFHSVIIERLGDGHIKMHGIDELPSLEMIKESADKKAWFPVAGMFGGFEFWIDRTDNGQYQLISESWSRVVGGSGQRHVVTVDGYELVEEGFV